MEANQLVESLVRIASVSPEQAKSLLEQAGGDLDAAVKLLVAPPPPTSKTPNQLLFSAFREFLDKAEAKKRAD